MAIRRTDIQRDSAPASHELFPDKEEKAKLEARNGLLQFDEVLRLADGAFASKSFRLRPSTIQSFQRIAIKDIYTCAGNFRTGPVSIIGTSHQPPPTETIAEHVEDLCDYVNDPTGKTPIHLASYVMWRVNWIHPFTGGNGRTSRATSYLVLLASLGYRLPGSISIADSIVKNRQPYYEALDSADIAWSNGELDVSKMEDLLASLLAEQLVAVHRKATGQ